MFVNIKALFDETMIQIADVLVRRQLNENSFPINTRRFPIRLFCNKFSKWSHVSTILCQRWCTAHSTDTVQLQNKWPTSDIKALHALQINSK